MHNTDDKTLSVHSSNYQLTKVMRSDMQAFSMRKNIMNKLCRHGKGRQKIQGIVQFLPQRQFLEWRLNVVDLCSSGND